MRGFLVGVIRQENEARATLAALWCCRISGALWVVLVLHALIIMCFGH